MYLKRGVCFLCLLFITLSTYAQDNERLGAGSLRHIQDLTFSLQSLEDRDIDNTYLSKQDSLFVEDHYDVALDMFSSFINRYISPIEFAVVLDQVSIADAQDHVCEDMYFQPDENTVLVNERKINFRYVPQVSDKEIADRLSCLKSNGIPLTFNAEVRRFVDYMSVKRRNYTKEMLRRKEIYFPLFERVLKEYEVPDDLKYLAIVESALKPTAVSRVGAGGLWQFMPSTGRLYGLKQTAYIDERMDPKKSTVAAAKYLKALHKYFKGDWELALAAYNCGPGRVKRAQRRSGKQKFWDIYNFLPKETRSYVPMFIAVTYVMHYAEEHNILQNDPIYPIETDTIILNQYVNLKVLAKKLNVCSKDLTNLNPELRRNIVPHGTYNYDLKIPSVRKPFFEENKQAILGKIKQAPHKYRKPYVTLVSTKIKKSVKKIQYSKKKLAISKPQSASIKHKIRRGESLNLIAYKYKVSVSAIKRWNGLRSNLIHAGKYLKIYRNGHVPTKSSQKYSNRTLKKTKRSKKSKYYVVNKGDSLWEIAQRKGTSVSKIKSLNKISSDKLNIGQKLRIR